MSDFKPFAQSVFTRFNQMSAHELFVVDLSGDEVWEAYIGAFPDGTNRLYKTRTEFDCSCCKQVVRNIGNVVRISDVNKEPVWEYADLEYPFNVVASVLHDLVMSKPVVGLFRASEPTYGSEVTRQLVKDNKGAVSTVKEWNHFHVKIASNHFLKDSGPVKGEYASATHVFKRGLEELSPAAVQQVLELIDSNALYRGVEHKAAVQGFATMQAKYGRLKSDDSKNNFVWANAKSTGSRFRNTVIGTLVQDLSEGKDLEQAVKSFESKVAPTNYKRTTALITPKMIEAAQKTLAELGLEEAIQRRFAKLSDVSVNNVLWVDNSARAQMKEGIAGLLADQVKKTVISLDDYAPSITIETFMSDVLPKAQAIGVMLKSVHMSNFVSITAGDDPAKLFKWGNNFAWSYDGNVTDSIKDRVAKAGGNVTNAKLRISLAWFNYDDLDIYVTEPDGNTLCFYQKSSLNGRLDVDMNISPSTRQAVENVSFTRVQDGIYKVAVSCYTKRESIDVGCTIEVENNGKIVQLSRAQAITGSGRGTSVHIANVHVRNGMVEKIDPAKGVVGGGFSQEKWGVKTEDFVKVQTLMFSPNFWDDQAVGNKHWFFILEGCKADMPARGIYNEFLRSDLDKHRKVFEILGDKTKCDVVDEQLSGVGFSSTRKDELTVRVKTGKIEKLYNIVF